MSVEPEHPLHQTLTSAPRSRSPSSSEVDFVFSHSEILEYVWFQKLVNLMFTLTEGIMMRVLVFFPGSPTAQVDGRITRNLADKIVLSSILLSYVLLFSCCWLIILLFTSICLAIHFKKMRLPIVARWRDRYEQQYPNWYFINTFMFWFVWMVFLLGLPICLPVFLV